MSRLRLRRPADGARPPGTGDERITADIRARLAKVPALLGGYNITVDTTGGVVQLYGTVDTELELAEAEAIVREVPGVREIRDDIAVNNFKD